MTTRLFLIATIVAASYLTLDTSEAQAQAWRNSSRGYVGQRTQVSSYFSTRAPAFSNQSYRVQSYTPYARYVPSYGNFGSYGYPSGYSYGNNFGNFGGYGYPSGVIYGNNFGNYGYRNNNNVRFGSWNSGFNNFGGFRF